MQQLIGRMILGFCLSLGMSAAALAEIVNLNKADASAFQANLKGIGAVKAKAIVDFRKDNGAFKSIDDLKKVPGIGEATFKKIKSDLSLSKGVTTATAEQKKTLSKAKSSSKSTTKTTEKSTKATQEKSSSSKASTTKTTTTDKKASNTKSKSDSKDIKKVVTKSSDKAKQSSDKKDDKSKN